jgi:hypothetical protein
MNPIFVLVILKDQTEETSYLHGLALFFAVYESMNPKEFFLSNFDIPGLSGTTISKMIY